MSKLLKSILSLMLAVPLLYFPGGSFLGELKAAGFEAIDTKEEVVEISLKYEKALADEKIHVKNSLNVEELALAEAVQAKLQQDSAYVAQVQLLNPKTSSND